MQLLPLILRFLFDYPDDELLRENWPEGQVLDLGAASGRVLGKALLDGRSVTGIDNDQALLDSANAYLQELKREHPELVGDAQVELVAGDFTQMDLGQLQNSPFDSIICAANTWSMVLGSEDRVRTLIQCRRALKPEGRLLIWIRSDTPSAQLHRRMEANTPYGPAEAELDWVEDFQARTRTYTMKLRLGDQTESHSFVTRMLSCSEVLAEASQAGLKIGATYGNFEGGALDPSNSAYQVFIFRP